MTPEQEIDVTVIVPVRNAEDLILEQLAALDRQTFDGTWEVLVAVQPSRDATEEQIAHFLHEHASTGRYRLVDAAHREGPAHARNRAALEARGALLAFCDADDVVDEGWLDALRRAATEDVVAGRIIPFSGEFQLRALDGREGYLPPVECGFLPTAYTCNMAVRRDAFERAGGFDEAFLTNEDVEFAWRMQLDGSRIVEAPEAVVYKRERPRLRDTWRQELRWAAYEPALYRKFRALGMPRDDASRVARDWAWLGLRLPLALVRRGRFRSFPRVSALRLGRLIGSTRERIVFL
jgi:GT2 family glycosyltransferase